ncbi:MAG: hypothetical protein JWQ70_2556 [Aeromicrobium sp.]|jgi:hypothetical protein|nr:hypothetical protein [Aeromicrobium sp.]
MMSYNQYAAAIFFVAAVVLFILGDAGLGVVFVAVGAVFVAINQMNGAKKP